MNNKFNSVCYIVGAAEPAEINLNFKPEKTDFVIAADGGFRYLQDARLRVDLLIGDFDSLKEKPDFPNTVALQKEKDVTDLYAAVTEGLKRGYRIFCIYGGTGGSMRHTAANIQTLKMLAEKGCRGYLFGGGEVLTVIKNETVLFNKNRIGYLSVFSLSGEAAGVTLKNLKYPLENYTMSDIYPVGVSNEFTGAAAEVSVKNGTLLLIYDFGGIVFI